MNNPLELLLRRQKAAQGGRIRFGGGGTMGSEDRGYQGKGIGSGDYGGNTGGNNKGGNKVDFNANRETTDAALDRLKTTGSSALPDDKSKQDQTTTVDVTPDVKQQSFLDRIFSGIFTKPTVKDDFVNKVKYNPKLNRFIKETYNVESVDDLTDAQVQAINDYNNLSYGEIKDALSNMTMSAITNPLGAAYNTTTMASLGLPGIGMTGMMNALANIAMQKPSYAKNLNNMDMYGNYIGPMSANPAVNQQIADVYGGLTAAQQAEAVAKAMSSAETGGMMSFGGDGQNKQLPQTTAQNTVQTYMDSLTENEIDRYNELIEQGYTDEYAKAYLGML